MRESGHLYQVDKKICWYMLSISSKLKVFLWDSYLMVYSYQNQRWSAHSIAEYFRSNYSLQDQLRSIWALKSYYYVLCINEKILSITLPRQELIANYLLLIHFNWLSFWKWQFQLFLVKNIYFYKQTMSYKS